MDVGERQGRGPLAAAAAECAAAWAAPGLDDGVASGVHIDYVHVAPPGPSGLGHVRAVRRVGDGPVDGGWPSDHAAVVADLADSPF